MSRVADLPTKKFLPLPLGGTYARALAVFLLTLGVLSVGVLALILGQDTNWDLRNYHWYNGYAFLNGREGFDLLPSQTPFFYNPLIDVPFYLLGTHASARVAAFVLGTVQGLNFVLLFMLAHASLVIESPRRKTLVCATLAAMGVLGGGALAQIGATFYDNVTSLGIFTAALLVLLNGEKLTNGPWRQAFTIAFLSGLPAGAMMGLKLPSVIFCVGLCGAFLGAGGTLTRRIGLAVTFGLGVLAGLTVTLGPWACFMQTHYGNPLFPYFNNFFKSPLAPLANSRDVQFLPHGLQDQLFFPFIFAHAPMRVGEIAWRDWRLPLLYALLPLTLILRLILRPKTASCPPLAAPFATRYLLSAGVLAYIVWLEMFAIYRYAIPLEMLAPLLIVMTFGLIPLRISARWGLSAASLLIVALSVQQGDWGRRASWLDHTVEAEIPALPNAAKTMILMAGFEPYAHLVPSFPPAIPFVRIQSNFASPDEGKGINQKLKERLDAHRAAGGTFMLLIPPWQHPLAADALKFYNLTFSPQSCRKVRDRLLNVTLDLCALDEHKSRTATKGTP